MKIKILKNRNLDGFTLIELLIVIAIIAILALMILPALGRARRKALEAACMNNLKQLYLTMSMYGSDYEERFPDADSTAFSDLGTLMLGGYVKSGEIFICPSNSSGYDRATTDTTLTQAIHLS